MDIAWLLSVINFTIASCITPGPNNMMLLSSGARFGYKKSIPHLFGILAGFAIMLASVGYGLGQIFIIWPMMQTMLAIFGTLFLLYLAYKTYKISDMNAIDTKAKPLRLIDAMAFQPLNPKAWVMAISSMSAFTQDVTQHNVAVMIIMASFSIANLLTGSLWLMSGITIGKIVKTKPQYFVYFNKFMAILLVLSITTIWVI